MLLARVFVWSGGFCLDERVFIWVRGFYLGGCQEKGYSLFKLSRLVASDGFCSLRVQLCVVGKNFLQVLDAWVLANTPFAQVDSKLVRGRVGVSVSHMCMVWKGRHRLALSLACLKSAGSCTFEFCHFSWEKFDDCLELIESSFV